MAYDSVMPVSQVGRELPRFTLRQEEMPGLGAWDVGSKHYLVIRVELVGKRNTKALGLNDSGDKEKVEGDFQVENVKPLGDKPVDAKTLEKRDFEQVVARVRSNKV